MHFYQHNIGDFNNATRHLSRLERSIYRDLLEHYYSTEKPLIADVERLARLCLVDENDRGAMRDVLNEYFLLQDDGYHNSRADKDIDTYQRMAKGGKAGAAKRWGNATPTTEPCPPYSNPHCAPDASPNAKQEPNPNTQYPEPNNQKKDTTEQDLERVQENSPKVSSYSLNLHSESFKTTAGEICATLKTQGITGVNPSYQPLLEAIAQGCNLRDFNHAVEVAKEAKKTTFPYIVGIAKNAMTDAKHRLASPSKSMSTKNSIQFTADVLTGRAKLPKTQDLRDITASYHIIN